MCNDKGDTFIAALHSVLLEPDLYNRLFLIIMFMNSVHTCLFSLRVLHGVLWRKGEKCGYFTVTGRVKGGTTRTRAHAQARTLPNPEALGPEIEKGAFKQRPLQALFLLPWGGARPATGPGAI